MALSPKQKKFVREYCVTLNATAAAKKAGYSAKTAHVQGPRLLGNVRIKEAISKKLRESTARAEMSLDIVLGELKRIMVADMAQYARWNRDAVFMKPSDELTPDLTAAVESVSAFTSKEGATRVQLKLHNKLRAAELILKVFELSEVEARLAKVEERLDAKA